VALKKLPESLKEHPTAARQFLREAQSVAALDHPNIATLFDADQDDQGVYFLTMELLEGQSLDKLLEQRGPLPLGEVLQMGYEIASGLQFAHEQRIVHRDIKPANLFYTSANHVKIMDFGLAKMLEQVASTTSSISPYMAPEQAQGEAIDHRVDQYALGVTLFHMLTGRVPSERGDAPTDPRELVADASEGLSELIVQLMSKQPDERFASTGEISDRIAALVCSAL
jgi:serine/threonine-protein kinase